MICSRCGQTHDPKRCTGHVDRPDEGTLRPCGNWPVKGVKVCWKHGGNAPQVRAAGQRRLRAAEAWDDVARLGLAIAVDDGDALVAMRDEAAGNVAVLRVMVQQLKDPDKVLIDPDEFLDTLQGERAQTLYVRLFHQTGKPTGEAKPHVLVAMYNDERDRLAKLDEICVKLGLEARRVRVEEATVTLVAGVMDAVLVKVLPADLAGLVRGEMAEELLKLADTERTQ